jgi:hypothetical protein
MLKDIVIQLALKTWWQKHLMFAYLSKRYFELMDINSIFIKLSLLSFKKNPIFNLLLQTASVILGLS